MRILHVITPKHLSGAEVICGQVCEELMARGHEVLVVTKPCRAVEAYLADHQVPYRRAFVGGKGNFLAPFVIAWLARRMKADLIHTHNSTASMWGSIAAWLAGVPSVAYAQAVNTSIWLVWSTRIIACAGAVREHLVAEGRRPERIDVVPNAIDLDSLAPVDATAVRAGLGVAPEAPLIVVVAHLSHKKGHRVLWQALATLRDRFAGLRCLALGLGPDREALEQLAASLGLAEVVQLLGFRSDAVDVMAAADVVVLPSVGGEGLPLVLLEAAARSRPVVATRLAGVPELVVEGETGFVVTPGDADELADRLAQLLNDPALRERMGQAAYARVARDFSRRARAEGIEASYRRALEGRKGS
jgi:glycosyltransferase involved in cell wall biosynthesis